MKVTFSIQHSGGIDNIDNSDFNISKGHLEGLVRVYKGHYSDKGGVIMNETILF